MKDMKPLDARLAKVEDALAKAEEKTVKLLKAMDEADKKLELSSDAVAQSEAAFAKASADVEKGQTSQGALLVKLVELIQQEQHTLQLKLLEQHKNATALLNTNEATLSTLSSLGASKDGCNDARVAIIKTKQALVTTGTALDACLKAKKEIQAKIDAAMTMGQEAQEGLTRCLQNKAALKAKIKACHEKRDEAREKLKACLDRKVVLKKQIDACHAKRDEARKKLQDCLSRKAELKGKISKVKAEMKAREAEMQPKFGSLSLEQLQQQESGILQDVQDALATLQDSDQALQDALATLSEADDDDKAQIEALIKAGADTDEVSASVQSAEEEEGKATALTDAMVDGLKLVLHELKSAAAETEGAENANADAAGSSLLLQEQLAKLSETFGQ